MKHKINKEKQDLLGQYMTVQADKLLENFKDIPMDRLVTDPCAGHGDLLSWAWGNGALDIFGYDIDPKHEDVLNDMFVNPVDCEGTLVVTNPPYLLKSRAGVDKSAYDKWGQNDLYKCYLATLETSNVPEAIIIQPSNFLCESSSKARAMLFENYYIEYAEHWEEKNIFPGVAIGIMVMHIKKGSCKDQKFEYLNRTTGKVTKMHLEAHNGFIFGGNEFINKNHFKFNKAIKGEAAPNSNILISFLDDNARPLGYYYNEGDPHFTSRAGMTTYQVNTPFPLTEEDQKDIVKIANASLRALRKKYDSMFLSNFIAAGCKIMSKTIAEKILTTSIIKQYGKR